jgi:predicted lysophospholipase L1 biosynthesis ABC-type transport system permease subunit
MAKKYWPNDFPLGKNVRIGKSLSEPVEIVGIVEDIAMHRLGEDPMPYLYFPLTQMPRSEKVLMVETYGQPTNLAASMRKLMREINSNVLLLESTTQEQSIHLAMLPQQIAAALLCLFGLLAILLAGIGIYGVVSYSVKQRTREIGIRIAIGAPARRILHLFMLRGTVLSSIGLTIGLPLAIVLSHTIEGQEFYGVNASNPTCYIVSSALILAIILMASYFPARRATKVDPMVALRSE